MVDDDAPRILVCIRVDDVPTPRIPSVQTVCGRCLAAVWKSRRGWWWTGPVLCVQCVLLDPVSDTVEGAPWVRDDLADSPALDRIVDRITRRTDA